MTNAEDLLADAQLLAEAGRFARAHALAALACEELGKSDNCLHAIWSPSGSPAFWSAFADHGRKLWHTQTMIVLESADPASSRQSLSERIRQESRAAHQRKLRGLYVDYVGGKLRLPSEIEEQEAWQLIHRVRAELDRGQSSWDNRASTADFLSTVSVVGRLLWILIVAWAADAETEIVIAVIQDGWSDATFGELLHRFQDHLESVGGLKAFLSRQLATSPAS